MLRLIMLIFAMVFFSGTANAVSILTSNGQLVGARGVQVGSLSFDFDIVDGSCVSVFNGCDEQSDFFFTDQFLAADVMLAVRDTVFIDGAQGAFDSDPSLTLGCQSRFGFCAIFAPVALGIPGPDFVPAVGVRNDEGLRRDDVTSGTAARFADTDEITWAVFRASGVTSIPVPPTILLFFSLIAMWASASIIRARQKI